MTASLRGVAPRRLPRWVDFRGSTWPLGILAALVGWSVTVQRPGVGLDPSWEAALYMGTHAGLHYGSQLVFTYGPLGFLRFPGLWDSGLGWAAFLYSSSLYLTLGVSLVWALRRTFPGWLALLMGGLILLTTSPVVEVPIALATVWCLVALSPAPPRWTVGLVAVGGGTLGGLECLVLLRSGPIVLLLGALTLLALRPGRTWAAAFAGSALVSFLAGWWASGQGLGNLGSFIVNGWQIVSGYGEAMGAEHPARWLPVAVIAMALALIAAAALTSAGAQRRLGGTVVMAVAMLALYKEAIVRDDYGHAAILFGTAVVIGAGLRYGVRRLTGSVVLAGLVAVAVVMPRMPDIALSLNPFRHVQQATKDVAALLAPSQGQNAARFGMLVFYRLDPQVVSLLQEQTTDILPWEQGVAWALRLRWHPLPVFQSYSAYTSRLDQLNARALNDPQAPQRLLRENTVLVDPDHIQAIDRRFAGWDPPAQTLAMLCHYTPLLTTARWEVLGRVRDRCGESVRVGTLSATEGVSVRLPPAPAGAVLLARVRGVAVSGSERLRTLLYRARYRYVEVNGRDTYRLVPGTASDGLLLAVPTSLDYPGPYAVSPQARTLRFSGAGGTVRLDLYEVPLRAS